MIIHAIKSIGVVTQIMPRMHMDNRRKSKESTIVCRVAVTEEAMGVFSVVETVWAERILVRSVKDAS